MVARHAYALTFEKEYVQQWEDQLSKGLWGGKTAETHEVTDEEGRDALRPR